MSKPRTVDVDMSVRVGTFAGVVNGRAKAGTMFWTDDGGGGSAQLFGMPTGNKGVTMTTRRSKGGHSNHIGGNFRTRPRQKFSWLWLVRRGIQVTF